MIEVEHLSKTQAMHVHAGHVASGMLRERPYPGEPGIKTTVTSCSSGMLPSKSSVYPSVMLIWGRYTVLPL